MAEKQRYFEELVEYILEKYYQVEIKRSQTMEATLPNVRIDMLFEVPLGALKKGVKTSPLPHLAEVNIVHLKAIQDTLTWEDIVQYLGEIYVISTSAPYKEKTTALIIVTTQNLSQTVKEKLWSPIEQTERPWIYKIGAEVPSYLFLVDELPVEEEEYSYFGPFQSLGKIRKRKEYFKKIAGSQSSKEDENIILFWLRKLYPDFYNEEFGAMPINKDEIVKTLYPETLEKQKQETIREDIIKILEIKFGSLSDKIKTRINEISSLEALDLLFKSAVKSETLESFTNSL